MLYYMIQKQTVFIKEIHHYDWLIRSHNDDLIGHVKEQEGYFFTTQELNNYTREVIKQALETAAEKAMIDRKPTGEGESSEEYTGKSFEGDLGYEDYIPVEYTINTDSIINTAEETFKKFEV